MGKNLLERIMRARGISSKDEIFKYLNPNLDRDWENPYSIKGMDSLADKIEKSMRCGDRILIYGDYDLDGLSSIVVMLRGLAAIDKHVNAGMKLDYFLPKRFEEGYGLTDKSVARLLDTKTHPNLIITVDCGVTAKKEIQILKNAGIDVVVTDHHEKSSDYPDDVELIDPKAEESDNPNKILAGVGVALKLIQVLCTRFGLPNIWLDLIDFATLGTIADIMPLVGQNRALVSAGIEHINNQTRPCIKSILDLANREVGKLTSTDIAYVITPRLNAAGRLDKPDLALNLMMCDNYAQAYNYALEIEDINNQRKQLSQEVFNQADYRVKIQIENNPDMRCVVLHDANWHKGILGIVAAQIADKYCLPCILLCDDDDLASGSGRSYGQVNLHEACMKAFDSFEKFGGHSGACGLTIKKDSIADFIKGLDKYLVSLPQEDFIKRYDYDLKLNLSDLNIEDIESLSQMEPFGHENQEPLFYSENVLIKRAKAVGASSNHLSCFITDGVYGAHSIMFNVSDIDTYLKIDSTVNTIYNLRIDEFRDNKNIKLYLSDIFIDKQQTSNKTTLVDDLLEVDNAENSKSTNIGDIIQNSVNNFNNEFLSSCKRISESLDRNMNINKDDFAGKSIEDAQQDIVFEMIGKDNRLHDSQLQSLNLLNQNKNVLSIMPTARGKSLIFQTYAASLAITKNKMSIFVYPLRALISDQVFHLKNKLSKFNLNITALNGETPNEQRKQIYDQISNRSIDILLTTPEFLAIHLDEFSQIADVGFIVIDEAHYLGKVKIGDRTAYGHMPCIIDKLKSPQVLAVSATVNDEILNQIKNFINIDEVVRDDFARENLYIDDRRNIKCRDDYLVSLCASGEKIVIYVNSRQQTVDLARIIKSRAPHIAMKVGFYNGGMTHEDRNKIEDMFRNNDLSVLVATSAFGEGVNISDIRHVCLYHLPFSNVEFNQMAGRCGRDNNPAIVHLLYNRADATINKNILYMCNPNRDVLAKSYSWIKQQCLSCNNNFSTCLNEIQALFEKGVVPVPLASFLSSLDIFEELGLINVETMRKDDLNYSTISIVNSSSRVALEDSSRFCEGQNELTKFEDYRISAMRLTKKELTNILRHPILPGESFVENIKA